MPSKILWEIGKNYQIVKKNSNTNIQGNCPVYYKIIWVRGSK
jgi:hypothetical protein